MDTVHRLCRRLLPVTLGLLAALPAGAFVNDIEIVVARGRLGQCGSGWDPQHTGRWSGGTGSIVVQGRKLHEFNLSDPAECDRVLRTRVDAPANQRIEVVVINQGGSNRMAAPLTTVAADRVWRVEYFADQAWGNVVSTNWPKDPPAASAGGYANDIRIRVAPGRLSQCGAGWDPQRTGHWSGNIGSIFVDGRKVHDFNLALQAECDLVTSTRIVAGPNQRIEVLVVNQGGSNRMAAPLTTVAADRVWQVEYFADQASGSVVSTDWPAAGSGPSNPDRPAGPAPVKPPPPAPVARGYQLFFDGKLVSGPDAEFYTRQQALDNCAWNRRTKPHIRIECVHNGQPLNP